MSASNSQSNSLANLVKLNGMERNYYTTLFHQAASKGSNQVSGPQAVHFFQRSGLEKEKLVRIWKLSARQNGKFLNPPEFFVALKLIAFEQNGIKSEASSLQQNKQAPLPKFQGIQMPKMNQNARGPPNVIPNQNENSFAIKPDDLCKFQNIFNQFDQGNGIIVDTEMQKLMQNAKLPREACEQVWELANPDGLEEFTKPMFMVTMQLMKKFTEGVPLPKELPLELKQRGSGPASAPVAPPQAPPMQRPQPQAVPQRLSLTIPQQMGQPQGSISPRSMSPRNSSQDPFNFGGPSAPQMQPQQNLAPPNMVASAPPMAPQSVAGQQVNADAQMFDGFNPIEAAEKELSFLKQLYSQDEDFLNQLTKQNERIKANISKSDNEIQQLDIKIKEFGGQSAPVAQAAPAQVIPQKKPVASPVQPPVSMPAASALASSGFDFGAESKAEAAFDFGDVKIEAHKPQDKKIMAMEKDESNMSLTTYLKKNADGSQEKPKPVVPVSQDPDFGDPFADAMISNPSKPAQNIRPMAQAQPAEPEDELEKYLRLQREENEKKDQESALDNAFKSAVQAPPNFDEDDQQHHPEMDVPQGQQPQHSPDPAPIQQQNFDPQNFDQQQPGAFDFSQNDFSMPEPQAVDPSASGGFDFGIAAAADPSKQGAPDFSMEQKKDTNHNFGSFDF